MKRWLPVLIVLMLGALAFGCGDDDDAPSKPDSGMSPSGSGGSSGRGGGGGTGGSMAAVPVKCGTATCEAPAGTMGFVTACCIEATTTCGTSAMGGECAVPAESDPRCEPISVMGFMLPSCCTEAGQCGINASMFGMPGCLDLGMAAGMAQDGGGMGMGGVTLPPPRACDDTDGGKDGGGTDDDAGL